ncbi:hypothetical protein [Anaerosporobacter sp.]|nr:hypothetical protein [Anaerosporobacter sp.]
MDAEPALGEAGCRIEGVSVTYQQHIHTHLEVLSCVACFVL